MLPAALALPSKTHANSMHIKRGRNKDEYRENLVLSAKSTKDYEIELFRDFEPKFAALRAQSRRLGEIVRKLAYFERHGAELTQILNERG